MEKLQNLAVQAGLCRLRDSQIQWLQLQSNIRKKDRFLVLALRFLRSQDQWSYMESFHHLLLDWFIYSQSNGVVSMTSICGMQSLKFENAPYLKGWASVAGKKEGKALWEIWSIRSLKIHTLDKKAGNWQKAVLWNRQQCLQSVKLIFIRRISVTRLRVIFGTEYSNVFWNERTRDTVVWTFGACSTVGEAMSLAAMSVAGGFAKHSLAIASSHIGSAEKQFRFPLEYGNQRPLSATWTVTGSGGFIVSKKLVL